MKRLSVILAVIVVIVFALEAVPQEVTIEQAPLTWKQAAESDGETLFAQLCAVCHGVDGKGAGPAAKALSMPLPDLTLLAAHNDGVFPAERVEASITGRAEIVAHGSSEMPIWGVAFKDARPDQKMGQRNSLAFLRIHSLTVYVETLQAR